MVLFVIHFLLHISYQFVSANSENPYRDQPQAYYIFSFLFFPFYYAEKNLNGTLFITYDKKDNDFDHPISHLFNLTLGFTFQVKDCYLVVSLEGNDLFASRDRISKQFLPLFLIEFFLRYEQRFSKKRHKKPKYPVLGI